MGFFSTNLFCVKWDRGTYGMILEFPRRKYRPHDRREMQHFSFSPCISSRGRPTQSLELWPQGHAVSKFAMIQLHRLESHLICDDGEHLYLRSREHYCFRASEASSFQFFPYIRCNVSYGDCILCKQWHDRKARIVLDANYDSRFRNKFDTSRLPFLVY